MEKTVSCRWCGSDRRYGEACTACPCTIDTSEVIIASIQRLAATPRAPTDASIAPGALYSMREAAKLLRLDRSGTLRRAIGAGHVQAVKVGNATRIAGAELLRILVAGLPELPDARRPPGTKKQRRRAQKSNGAVVGSISKIPLVTSNKS